MFIFNPKSNLIERRELEYPLQDVEKPNLYDNLYSYDEVPKIAFNHRIVPIDTPDRIQILHLEMVSSQENLLQ